MKNDQRNSMSKRMLQEALIRLLAKKSLQQISVTELCSEASVNRSTFYRLYSIPVEVMEDIIQDIINEINAQMCFADGAREKNTIMIHRYILEHRDIIAPILRNYDYRIVTMLEKKFYSMFMKEYEGLMSEEKCRFLCAHLTAGGIAVAARWLDSDNPLSPEEMSEIYSSITNPPHRSLRAGDPEKK